MRVTVIDPAEVVSVGRVEHVRSVVGSDAVVVPKNKRIFLQRRTQRLGPCEVEVEGKVFGAFDPACLEAVVVRVTNVLIDVDSVGAVCSSKRTVVGLFVVWRALREILRVRRGNASDRVW